MKSINVLVKIQNHNRQNCKIKNKLETTRVTDKQDSRLRLERRK